MKGSGAQYVRFPSLHVAQRFDLDEPFLVYVRRDGYWN